MTQTVLSDKEVLTRLQGLVNYQMNQKRLAHLCGISVPTVSRVLSGKLAPTATMLRLIGVARQQIYVEAEPTCYEPMPIGLKKPKSSATTWKASRA